MQSTKPASNRDYQAEFERFETFFSALSKSLR
jgi:hypothetical protein